MAKAIVFPAKGIGDAILMMIASHNLFLSGFEVMTYHPSLKELQAWFPHHFFSSISREELPVSLLTEADLIVLENDNTPFSHKLIQLRKDKILPHLSVFYPSYSGMKHAPLGALDQIFESNISMADNLSISIARLLKHPLSSKNNGLTPPPFLCHRKEKNRVLIHPTSSQKHKNWLASKFLSIATMLKEENYEVVFTVSPHEQNEWKHLVQDRFELPYFSTLSDLAEYIYESGYMIGNDSLMGHLASNLNIPTLIISNNGKRMKLWRPGWLKGEILTPPSFIPNWKWMRLREKYWQKYIPVSSALKSFYKLSRSF